ncbi:MAG: DUF4070 domain-containing protein [Spirochaetes bacterium]|nr:DUF4070 domain-containing protein [Spirochaetota bacterium]
MKKRILMVYPEIPVSYWSFKYILKLVGRRAAFPPLGLMTVAALLPDDYEVTLVDMNTRPLRDRDILKADMVFVSAMMIQKESFERVVAACNLLGKPVVAGGPYPTGSHESIAGVDHFVLGEAETTLPQFLRDRDAGAARRMYRSDRRPDISMTPVPRFDLVRHRHYTMMSLQYSRGCPFNCEFCDIIELFGRVSRTKEPEQFVREMDALYRTGYRGPLFIVDDNFIGNKKNVRRLLPAISRWQKERGYPFMITTEASVNLAEDGELMEMMLDAGFNKVFLGIETPVEESLILSNKKQNVALPLLESVERIQRAGMEVSAGFILGFDSDPENVFDIQMDFIGRSGIPMAMAGLLIALPNTQLYRRLEAEGRIVRESSGNNTHNFTMNFIPVMDRDRLIRGYKRLISHIYSPREYFNRCLVLMERMPKGRVGKGAFSFWTVLLVVRIFFASLFRQMFSSYGGEYIKYLAAAVRMRPGMFPKAVKMALFGHHFFRITREIVAADDVSASIESVRERLRRRIEMLRQGRLEDVIQDAPMIDREVLGGAFIAGVRRKYRMLHDDFRPLLEEPLKRLMDDFRLYVETLIQMMRKRMAAGGSGSLDELRQLCDDMKHRARKHYRHSSREFRAYYKGLIEYFERRIDGIILDLESRCVADNRPVSDR